MLLHDFVPESEQLHDYPFVKASNFKHFLELTICTNRCLPTLTLARHFLQHGGVGLSPGNGGNALGSLKGGGVSGGSVTRGGGIGEF
jgi:hypothetical protein